MSISDKVLNVLKVMKESIKQNSFNESEINSIDEIINYINSIEN